MKKLTKQIQQGFTMIELLIVIAVLGILAVAVLSAINPIEQINRSKDTGSRSDAEQLISGTDRYYTQKGYYPWQSGATDISNLTAMSSFVNTTTLVNNVLSELSGSTGELKNSYINRIVATGYNYLQIHNRGTQGDSTYVCFKPTSKSFLSDAQTRCTNGLPPDLNDIVGSVCGASPYTGAYSCLP